MQISWRSQGHHLPPPPNQKWLLTLTPAAHTQGTRCIVYSCSLRGLPIVVPNQVWSIDITYIHVRGGFAYLVAVIDWYSRAVLSWRISNTMDTSFCVDCLEEAIRLHGKPEIFNSDQGSQFNSEAFTGVLKEHGIAISMISTNSMDGRGRGRAWAGAGQHLCGALVAQREIRGHLPQGLQHFG